MNQPLKILTTQDGSRTLYSSRYQQFFHSVHGALTESWHVFLEGAEIENLFQSRREATILEIGFGVGLNWLLTASLALRYNVRLTYIGMDQWVPCSELFSDLRYKELVEFPVLADAFIKWRSTLPDKIPNDSYKLTHKRGSVLQLQIGDAAGIPLQPCSCDRIYLDAFDPRTNRELWTTEFIQRLHNALHPRGIPATYCAAGHVRRALSASGFSVTRRPGPPGKREVLVVQKLANPSQ